LIRQVLGWPPTYAAPGRRRLASSGWTSPTIPKTRKRGIPKDPKFAGWKKDEKKGGVYEKAQQDRQQLQQLRFLEALLPCPSVSEFFALFLQIVLDVLLTPVHFHMR